MTTSSFDIPSDRGSDWQQRSAEVQERDNWTCQRCGTQTSNQPEEDVQLHVHHLIPGKYLPFEDARVDLNLITLCRGCHTTLEGKHIEYQLAETNRTDALRILELVKQGRKTPHSLGEELTISELQIEMLAQQLAQMRCLSIPRDGVYLSVCPGSSKARAERYEVQLKKEIESNGL